MKTVYSSHELLLHQPQTSPQNSTPISSHLPPTVCRRADGNLVDVSDLATLYPQDIRTACAVWLCLVKEGKVVEDGDGAEVLIDDVATVFGAGGG